MDQNHPPRLSNKKDASRRTFLKNTTGAVVGTSLASILPVSRFAHAAGSDHVRIGLVGCGGRGSGAAAQALRAEPSAQLVAMADAFEDRLHRGLSSLLGDEELSKRIQVDPDHQFVGFDAYKQVIESGVDVVLLATPPHFRPMHLKAAIEAGKHVFAEKPVAVDAPGVRSVLETTELAKKKNLSIVSGLNTRYSPLAQEMVRRIHDGAIGEINALHAARYAQGVWVRERQPGMTEMQYQMHNWYYFTWLSGDFNVEQFVHQLDKMAWVMNAYPVRCYCTGGRQARTGPEYGHIYDHFSSVYEFENGARLFATTRHQSGCSSQMTQMAAGTEGTADFGAHSISGKSPWQAPRGPRTDSHQLEQNEFFKALREGRIINNGEYMAKSTLMAIMERMSAYTGQTLTWEQAMNSQERLAPSAYTWDAAPPPAEVAVPGVTKFA